MSKISNQQKATHLPNHSRNAIWNVLDLLVPPAFMLILSPLYISHMGSEAFGFWMLFYTFIGLLGAVNFGLSDTTVKFVAAKHESVDSRSTQIFVTTILTAFLILSCIVALGFVFASDWLVRKVFHFDQGFVEMARQLMPLGGLWVALKLLESGMSAVVKGVQLFDKAGKISLSANLSTLVFALVSQSLELAFFWVLIFAIIFSVIAIGLFYSLIKSIFHFETLSPGGSLSVLMPTRTFSFWAWIQGLSGAVFNQADKILIASLVSVSNLPIYVICLQIAQLIHSFIAAATAFLFPVTSSLIEKDTDSDLGPIFHKVLAFVIPVVVAIAGFIFLAGGELLELFFGYEYYVRGEKLLQIQVLVFSGTALTAAPYYLLNGAGLVKFNVYFASVSALLIILLSAPLISEYGIIGGGYARLFNFAVVAAYLLFTKFKLMPNYSWWSVARLMCSFFVPLLLIYYIYSILPKEATLMQTLVWSCLSSAGAFFVSILINGPGYYGINKGALRDSTGA